MIPRGKVGLIFASVGLARGLISQEMFTAIVLTVMATTFVTPPLLKGITGRDPRKIETHDTLEEAVASPRHPFAAVPGSPMH